MSKYKSFGNTIHDVEDFLVVFGSSILQINASTYLQLELWYCSL